MHHRMASAEAQRIRLIRFLHGSRGISLRKRVLLWQSCVWTSASYGLSIMGFSDSGAAAFSARILRHLRAIACSPVHLTGESNKNLLLRLGLRHPVQIVAECSKALYAKYKASSDPMVNDPEVISHLEQVAATSHEQWLNLINKPELTTTAEVQMFLPMQGAARGEFIAGRYGVRVAQFPCAQCDLCFADLSALKRHMVKGHGTPMPSWSGSYERGAHSKDGLPTCRYCLSDFSSWNHLRRHIVDNNCQVLWLREHGRKGPEEASVQCTSNPCPSPTAAVLPAASTPTQLLADSVSDGAQEVPIAPDMASAAPEMPQPQAVASIPCLQREALIRVATTKGWLALLEDDTLRRELAVYCVICGQWLADKTQMKIHIQRIHHGLWTTHNARATAECKLQSHLIRKPCSFCGAAANKPRQHAFACTVMWQAAVLFCVLVPSDESPIAPPVPKPGKPQPTSLLEDASVLSAWHTGGLSALLEHHAILGSALQCVLCGAVIKTHKRVQLFANARMTSASTEGAASSTPC